MPSRRARVLLGRTAVALTIFAIAVALRDTVNTSRAPRPVRLYRLGALVPGTVSPQLQQIAEVRGYVQYGDVSWLDDSSRGTRAERSRAWAHVAESRREFGVPCGDPGRNPALNA